MKIAMRTSWLPPLSTNDWSDTAGILLSGTLPVKWSYGAPINGLVRFIRFWQVSHHDSSRLPSSAENAVLYELQKTIELRMSKKEALLGLGWLATRECWRQVAPIVLQARDSAPRQDRASQDRVVANELATNELATNPAWRGRAVGSLTADEVATLLRQGHVSRGMDLYRYFHAQDSQDALSRSQVAPITARWCVGHWRSWQQWHDGISFVSNVWPTWHTSTFHFWVSRDSGYPRPISEHIWIL